MFRVAILAVSLALLSGCWGAETKLFGTGDWVQPPGMTGGFVTEDAAGEAQGTVELVRRADGLIEGTVTRKGEDKPSTSPVGFVAIPGGSGRYFLMVNRAPGEKAGEFYLVGRWKNERLEAYWPQCAGTPDLAGMSRATVEFVNEAVCTFASKQAVLTAALLAERELETKRMFAPQLLGRLKRPDKSLAPAPEPKSDD